MSDLADALIDLNEEKVAKLVQDRITTGVDAISVINELSKGMDTVGDRFKSGEYFLSELIISGEIFKEAMKSLEPLLETGAETNKATKLVLGTVKGDIHNIGKDIVAILLKAAGFQVYDLGIDVPVKAFVDKLKETEAPILGMSGLLTPAFDSMKETVEAIKAAGLRDKVKIIIGGGIVTEIAARHAGADAFTDDAIEGIEICKKFAEEVK